MPPVSFTPRPYQMSVLQWDGENATEMKEWCGTGPGELPSAFFLAEEKPEYVEEEWTVPHVWNIGQEEWLPVPDDAWIYSPGGTLVIFTSEAIQAQWKPAEL